MNELHVAAFHGSTRLVAAVLAQGHIDMNERAPEGMTALMYAAQVGHSDVISMLVDNGADVSVLSDAGLTALMFSAQTGHLASAVLLVKAGSDLHVADHRTGCTALHLAGFCGHSALVRMLIEAGANPDARAPDGATPLFQAALSGHLGAVAQLVRAKANPLLAMTNGREVTYPLDAAALNGHLAIVRMLVQEHGLGGCCGHSGGVHALRLAGEKQREDVLAYLTDAGVVDTGIALVIAAEHGRERSVKFLLRQQEGRAPSGLAAYVNARAFAGRTALFSSVLFCGQAFPRVVRRLIDAGADTSLKGPIGDSFGRTVLSITPLAVVVRTLAEKVDMDGAAVTEDHLQRVEAIRRLLLRVEAVRAVSWLWPGDGVGPCVPRPAPQTGARRTAARTPTPLARMLPILRRRAARRGVVLASMFRCEVG